MKRSAKTNPVPYLARNWNGLIPEANDECWNTDAGGIDLNSDDQLCY
jgi:hypothetical protein